MKHYDYVEWLLYKNHILAPKLSEEMEKHLYGCNTCMEIFLSLIDEEEERSAGEFISDDFTPKLINKIPKVKGKEKKSKGVIKTFNYQFAYYVAVASVTIILTLAGLYVDLVDAVPKITDSIELGNNETNKISEFSNKIVDSTSNFLSSIEQAGNKENNRRENNE